jgi:very-short-patch-repair endonuclease
VVTGKVLTTAGFPIGMAVRDLAAHLAVNGSVLAGLSAAREWDMPVPASDPCLLIRPSLHPRLGGIRYLRIPVSPRDVCRSSGADVTTRARTVFDCLRLMADREAELLLDRALHRGWLSVDDLAERISANCGRHGQPRLLRLLASARDGTASPAERLAASLLRRAGITGWQGNQPIYDARGLAAIGDLVFEAERLVVELDGRAFHSDVDAFQRDRTRQNRLVAAGWTVLRFTWRDLTERPGYVVATIRAMLSRLG